MPLNILNMYIDIQYIITSQSSHDIKLCSYDLSTVRFASCSEWFELIKSIQVGLSDFIKPKKRNEMKIR